MAETKICPDCKQEFSVSEHGKLIAPYFSVHSRTCDECGKPLVMMSEEHGRIHYHCPSCRFVAVASAFTGSSATYCPYCYIERRKKNRLAYPVCQMCNRPVRVCNFIHRYREFRLDAVYVCCRACFPRFDTLSEDEQVQKLYQAVVTTYGKEAVIYGLHYDDSEEVYHIGRTKRITSRIADYKKNWYREIRGYKILEHVSFGGLSVEREARWMLHALKYGWPIDNYDLLAPDKAASQSHIEAYIEGYMRDQQRKARLLAAAANMEPLTAPFEIIEPLLDNFVQAHDASIIHWVMGHME